MSTPRSPDDNDKLTVAHVLRLWLGIRSKVSRQAYAGSGFGLVALKYTVEAVVIYYYTRSILTPLEFLHPLLSQRTQMLEGAPEWLGWALFVWTLPFVWIAFSMSVRRAADAGLSPWLGLLILIPVVNLLVMLTLAVLPRATGETWKPENDPYTAYQAPQTTGEYWSAERQLRRGMPMSRTQRGMLAIGAAELVGLAMFGLGVYVLADYGASLFFGTPLLMGAVCAFVFNRPVPNSMASTLGVVTLSILIPGGILLVIALEGIICLVMAVPLVLPLALFGGAIGKAIADSTHSSYRGMASAIIALPLFAAGEALRGPVPESILLTSIEIDAPADVVWQNVLHFPTLPEPEEWYFRAGIAAPTAARIQGDGAGAVRYCEFTTGTFVEPITAWDAPHRLAFDVAAQPDPMFELSPYRHVHPPHMEHQTLRSKRGEFRFVALPNGKTRLEGRTWYEFDIHPHGYWTLWSDLIIRRIHFRVLDHIKNLSEGQASAGE